jgi:ABC-type transport system substrate-binding protein
MNQNQILSRKCGRAGDNPGGHNWRTKAGHLFRGPVKLATAGCLGIVLLLNWAVPLQSAQAATTSTTPLVIAVPSVPTSFDDSFAYQGVASQYADLQVADGLLRYAPLASDATKLQSATDLVGQLAQSWTHDANGDYTFVLRAAESPAGDAVTGQDVAWSFQRFFAVDPSAQFLVTGPISMRKTRSLLSPPRKSR